jgi:carboxypeptidase Q
MPNAAACLLLASALFVQAIAQPPPLPAHLAADAAAIIALANSSNTNGWDRLADWVDLHGARLSGSSQLEKALDYALAAMRSDGFDNVHEEMVNVSRWSRGEETLKMVAPYNKTLNFLSIGSSVGTSGAAIVAPILVVSSFDELTARKGEAAGKIVVFNYYCDWAGLGGLACYEKMAGYRSVGANAAAAAGAVAVLVRSLTQFSLGTPHTVRSRSTPRIALHDAPHTVHSTLLRMLPCRSRANV